MKLLICTLLLFINILNSQNTIKNFDYNILIDKNIQSIAEQKVEIYKKNILPDYKAHIEIDFFENDNLKGKINSLETGSAEAFIYKENDTIKIYGNYGLFEFSARLKEKKVQVVAPISSLDFPNFSLFEKGELKMKIDVPSEIISFTISEYPNPESDKFLYGYIEFKTIDFYKADRILNKKETKKRKKMSMKMKVFFKSKFIMEE